MGRLFLTLDAVIVWLILLKKHKLDTADKYK